MERRTKLERQEWDQKVKDEKLNCLVLRACDKPEGWLRALSLESCNLREEQAEASELVEVGQATWWLDRSQLGPDSTLGLVRPEDQWLRSVRGSRRVLFRFLDPAAQRLEWREANAKPPRKFPRDPGLGNWASAEGEAARYWAQRKGFKGIDVWLGSRIQLRMRVPLPLPLLLLPLLLNARPLLERGLVVGLLRLDVPLLPGRYLGNERLLIDPRPRGKAKVFMGANN